MRPGARARRLPGAGRPVLGPAATDPAGSTPGEGAHETAGNPAADGSRIALAALAPPVRRNHPGSDGHEIASRVSMSADRCPRQHLRDRSCRRRRVLGWWPSLALGCADTRRDSGRRPGPDRLANLPLGPERIDDPANTPAVLIASGRLLGGTRLYCPPQHSVGVIGHQQGSG